MHSLDTLVNSIFLAVRYLTFQSWRDVELNFSYTKKVERKIFLSTAVAKKSYFELLLSTKKQSFSVINNTRLLPKQKKKRNEISVIDKLKTIFSILLLRTQRHNSMKIYTFLLSSAMTFVEYLALCSIILYT